MAASKFDAKVLDADDTVADEANHTKNASRKFKKGGTDFDFACSDKARFRVSVFASRGTSRWCFV